jgi:hypothetical protein
LGSPLWDPQHPPHDPRPPLPPPPPPPPSKGEMRRIQSTIDEEFSRTDEEQWKNPPPTP